MDNVKCLDISMPWISGYPETGHLLAILQGHEEIYGWLFCNYIQLFSASDNHIDYFDIALEDCPFMSYNYVDKEWIFRLISIRDFVIMLINEGYYISLMINTGKIDAYDFNGAHAPLIYGYDLKHNRVYLADHLKKASIHLASVVLMSWKQHYI